MDSLKNEATVVRVMAAGALSWILPGLGHIYVGQRRRGFVLLIVIALTYWGGVAIAGVQSVVKPGERKMWTVAQICAGSHTLIAYAWGRARIDDNPQDRAGFSEEDVAVIYTGVAGLLSVLVILDALASADPHYTRVGVRPPPRRSGVT